MRRQLKRLARKIKRGRGRRFEAALNLFCAIQYVLKSKVSDAGLAGLAAVNPPLALGLKGAKAVLVALLPDIIKILKIIEVSDDKELNADNVEAVINKLLDLGYADKNVKKVIKLIEKSLKDNRLTISETVRILNQLN